MHMLLILLTLGLRKPYRINRLFSIAYVFVGNGWTFSDSLDGRDPVEYYGPALPAQRIGDLSAYPCGKRVQLPALLA